MKSPLDLSDEAFLELDELLPSSEYTFQSTYLRNFRVFSGKMKTILDDFKKDVRYIQGKVLKFMYLYHWPGNIRELQNFITQIMVFIERDTIRFEHLQTKDELDRMNTRSFSTKWQPEKKSKREIIDELLKEPFDLEVFTMDIVRATLEKFGGNKSKTAQFLGLKREQLYNRYKTD